MPKTRRVMLQYPPVSSPWHLPVGIAYLAAALKERGHEVAQRYGHIIGLQDVLYQHALSSYVQAHTVIHRPDSSIQELYQARKTLEEISHSLPHHDRKFVVERNNVSYVSRWYDHPELNDIQGILAAVENREQDMWFDYFWKVELPTATYFRPDLYGISISDERQLVPGLVLASMIKEALPLTCVVVGGNFWARVITQQSTQLMAPLIKLCDAIVYAEGFQPLVTLAETLDPATAPGTMWMDGTRVRLNPRPNVPTQFEDIPTPLFDGGATQWCPEPVYPLYTMSNCLMQCGFCDIEGSSDGFLGKPRMMSPGRIAEHFLRLGTHRFDITDAMFPVKRQIQVGEELRRLGVEATWQCYLTINDELLDPAVCQKLYEVGCRSVQLGLETLSRESLDREHKRWNRPENYGRILRNLRRAGIQTHIFIIVGLPGEPLHQVLKWLPFLEEFGDAILTIKCSRYRVNRLSPDVQFGRHKNRIRILPDTQPLHLNRRFEYISSDGHSLRKDVEAMRDLLEEACRCHWAYEVTSTIPWWINRGRYTWEELEAMAGNLPRSKSIPHLDRVLKRMNNILRRERNVVANIRTYKEAVEMAKNL